MQDKYQILPKLVSIKHARPGSLVQVLILSYETFRLHEERFRGDNVCDLLLCDEAHRLKNDQTLTNKVCPESRTSHACVHTPPAFPGRSMWLSVCSQSSTCSM